GSPTSTFFTFATYVTGDAASNGGIIAAASRVAPSAVAPSAPAPASAVIACDEEGREPEDEQALATSASPSPRLSRKRLRWAGAAGRLCRSRSRWAVMPTSYRRGAPRLRSTRTTGCCADANRRTPLDSELRRELQIAKYRNFRELGFEQFPEQPAHVRLHHEHGAGAAFGAQRMAHGADDLARQVGRERESCVRAAV